MSGIASRQNEILSKLGFNSYGAREFLPGNLDNEIVVPDINQYFSDQSIPLSKVDFVIYDAVVDQTGRGTHLTIQDALNSGKKRIFVRAGTYAPFTIAAANTYEGFSIVGENKHQTIIKIPDNSVNNTRAISIPIGDAPALNIEIKNLMINGNYANQDSGYTQYGIAASNVVLLKIIDCRVDYVQGYGIYIQNSGFVNIENSSIGGNQGESLYLKNSSNFTISKNSLGGISGKNGIVLDDCFRMDILDCNISEIGTDIANTYSGIVLKNTSFKNKILGNRIVQGVFGSIKYGVREESTSDDYNIINNSILEGITTEAISTQGANTIIGAENLII